MIHARTRTRKKWNELSATRKCVEEHLRVLAIMIAVFGGTLFLIGMSLIVWMWWDGLNFL